MRFFDVLGGYTNEVLLGRSHVWSLRQLSIALCNGLDGSLGSFAGSFRLKPGLNFSQHGSVLSVLLCSELGSHDDFGILRAFAWYSDGNLEKAAIN